MVNGLHSKENILDSLKIFESLKDSSPYLAPTSKIIFISFLGRCLKKILSQ
jgi:hypothetical protein